MGILTLQNGQKQLGLKTILRDADLSLEIGERVGLIGTNGSGKSTLLRMLAGLESLDSGRLQINSGLRLIYLPQEPDLDAGKTVLEQVFAGSDGPTALVREYELLSRRLEQGDASASTVNRLAALATAMEAEGGWELETTAKIILGRLGISDFEAKVGTLSGGYRKRIALASALLSAPDVLLMDEPTNHLDADAVQWLQEFLGKFRGAILLITHDRYFLDRVTNRILEIDRGDLFAYSGNYSYYLEKKALAEEAAASSQRKHQGILRRELEWLKRGPKARSTKQKARIERAMALKNTEFKEAKGKVEIATAGRRIGKLVIEADRVSKRFGERTIIRDFSYVFTPEDRIAFIGGNGAGKSTLMNILIGRIPPDGGTVTVGPTVHFGYFDQHSEPLLAAADQNQRVIDYIKEVGELVKLADGTVITAAQMLERFLFPGSQQYVPLHKLSGGERRRLFLLRVLMAAPNVLILDEPTNDLDVQTLSVLEEYLEDFNGCVIVVSHDRYFLDRVVDSVFAFESDGRLRHYPGNYSVYLEHHQREEKPEPMAVTSRNPAPKVAPPPPAAKPVAPATGKLSSKEKRELATLETKIAELEAERDRLAASLGNLGGDFQQANQIYERLGDLTRTLDEATERWLSLAERA